MQFQWGLASNDGGMTPVEGPKLDTFPEHTNNTTGNVQNVHLIAKHTFVHKTEFLHELLELL